MTRATKISSTQIFYTCPLCRTLHIPSKMIEHVTNNSLIGNLDNHIELSKPETNCKIRNITTLNIQIVDETLRI